MRNAAFGNRPGSHNTTPQNRGVVFPGAPGMGALLWVKVPPLVDHSERGEAQLHDGGECGEVAWSEAASR